MIALKRVCAAKLGYLELTNSEDDDNSSEDDSSSDELSEELDTSKLDTSELEDDLVEDELKIEDEMRTLDVGFAQAQTPNVFDVREEPSLASFRYAPEIRVPPKLRICPERTTVEGTTLAPRHTCERSNMNAKLIVQIFC